MARLYGNQKVLSLDNKLLFRTNKEKVDWYLSRNLADVIDDTTIRLRFKTKGPGARTTFELSEKENCCVVCGATEILDRHHVVPKCFRTHFPEHLKSHQSYDILLLCKSCHWKYETVANKKKRDLCKKHNIDINYYNYSLVASLPIPIRLFKILRTLKKHYSKIPDDKKIDMLIEIENIFGHIDIDQIEKDYQISTFSWKKHREQQKTFGYLVVQNTPDLIAFIKDWRKHFVDTMNPKFLSPHWTVDLEPL